MLQKLNAVQNHARRVGSSLDLKKYVSHRTISLDSLLVLPCLRIRERACSRDESSHQETQERTHGKVL